MSDAVRAIDGLFAIRGELRGAEPLGSGHIHESYLAAYESAGRVHRYVHQRLNTAVFRDAVGLMENLVRVTEHLRSRLAARDVRDVDRRCLRVVPARDGRPFAADPAGGLWRTTVYQEETRSVDTIEGPEQAFEVARAFGAFVDLLADLPPPPLRVTIPGFHDLGGRAAALEASIRGDARGRAAGASREIDAARRACARVSRLVQERGAADLPRRTMHNDCKLNNVLLDRESGEARCVIDLDTVMEGNVLCDFGELVRTAACTAPEDEAPAALDPELLRALGRGYREGAGAWLDAAEIGALPLAGPVLALENAVRFLTDHLDGDVYFRIHSKDHNLARCRAQLRRVELLLENLDAAAGAAP